LLVATNSSFLGSVRDYRRGERTTSEGSAQIRPCELLEDLFDGGEEKLLLLDNRAADGPAELLATKILERLTVRSIGRESLQTLVGEEAAVQHVGAGFGDNVHHATGGAAELCGCATGHHLKFLDRIQGDVNGRTLPALLLAEKSVVVVAAIKADVVEDTALAGEADFVAVRTLYNAYPRCER